jgi:hypothetical protein
MYKLTFYVPETHLEKVKQSVFATGAGKIGNYDSCCWQTEGRGQFRALDGANPFIGQPGAIETVQEFKVELVCEDAVIRQAVAALKQAHPYEEPAFDIWRLESI